MKNYAVIRGLVAEARCTNKGEYGSPLYCDCGCQTPQASDPEINLDGVTVRGKAMDGGYVLVRDGVVCGRLSTQYNAIAIDGNEFLDVDEAFLQDLIDEALSTKQETPEATGDTLGDTAVQVATTQRIEVTEEGKRNSEHPGYCTHCGSYCYGDCEANDN